MPLRLRCSRRVARWPPQLSASLKSNNNKLFAESLALTSSTNIGWAITALFYSALYLVDAYSAQSSHITPSHRLRNKEVQTNAHLETIAYDYLDLYTLSHHARYRMTLFTAEGYQEAHEYFVVVERHIKALLK